MHLTAAHEGQHPITVQLRFVQPVVALEHFSGECREHRFVRLRGLCPPSDWHTLGTWSESSVRVGRGSLPGFQILDARSAEDGAVLERHLAARILETVAALDEQ